MAVVFIYFQLWYTSFRKGCKRIYVKRNRYRILSPISFTKAKEHRKFLGNLKKKAPKNLDKIALEIHQEVF